ncbi:MAG: MATE family efflux transporter, partial [Lachnospiraceae bacterium]|nr:MATE family efflux transporter [Lachnospiraceae bacterium]
MIFSLPLMFSNVLQIVFNLSDIAIVGQFAGPIALGAVGSTTILIALVVGLLIGMSQGVNALTALFIGGDDYENEHTSIHCGAFLCAVIGVSVCVLSLILSKPVLELLGTKDELIEGA